VDAPVLFLGLEVEDWGCVLGVFFFFLEAWTPPIAIGALVATFIALRAVKKGQPPGILLHRLWTWQLLPLPGFPPPPPRGGRLWSPWR